MFNMSDKINGFWRFLPNSGMTFYHWPGKAARKKILKWFLHLGCCTVDARQPVLLPCVQRTWIPTLPWRQHQKALRCSKPTCLLGAPELAASKRSCDKLCLTSLTSYMMCTQGRLLPEVWSLLGAEITLFIFVSLSPSLVLGPALFLHSLLSTLILRTHSSG